MSKICVLGSGIAGLNAAFQLKKHPFDIQIFEKSDRLGGLASSFDFGGINIERFYHFICRGDSPLFAVAKELGIEQRIQWRTSRTGFYVNQKMYDFSSGLDLLKFKPLGLMQKLRFGSHIVYSQKLKNYAHLESITAVDWLTHWLGKEAYQTIWEPLLKIKFGEYHTQISASWIWHRIHRVATSREHMWDNEQYGYFDQGSDVILNALASVLQEQGVPIHLNQAITKIESGATKIKVHKASGEVEEFDKLISTIPLTVLGNLLETDDRLFKEHLSQYTYIGVVCMILKMKKPISPYYWLNINDPRIAFNGIIEYSNLHTELKEQAHVAYIPFYLDPKQERFGHSDEQLLEEYLAAIKIINPSFSRDDILDMRVFREQGAQAICGTHFAKEMLAAREYAGGVFISDSTQLYPEDRSLSGMIAVSNRAVEALKKSCGISP